MKTKYILALVTLTIFVLSAQVNAQSLNFKLSTYFYSWERTDSIASGYETSHMKGYQNLLLDITQDKWSLNTSLLTQEDIVNKSGDGFDYSFYNLYIKGSNLWNALDVGIGRQFIFAGVGNTSVDGLSLRYKAGMKKQYQISVFGGALTPDNYDFQSYSSFNNNFIFGSKFSYYGDQGFTGTLSYFLKRKQYDPYYAPRIDTMYNTTNELIVTDSKDQQLIGLNLNYTGKQNYTLYGKAFYDLYINKFYQAEFNFSYLIIDNFRMTLDYSYRGAQLTYNTTFWTMAQFWPLSHYQQLEATADYTLKNGMNLFATYSNVFYIDDNAAKYQFGFKTPAYGLYYIGYSGYSGESNGAVGYVYHQLVPEKLAGNVTLNYSNYNLGNYSSQNENQFSGIVGLAYRPNRQFTIDAQGQFITNRIYSIDSRFLLGVTYRLFSKF